MDGYRLLTTTAIASAAPIALEAPLNATARNVVMAYASVYCFEN